MSIRAPKVDSKEYEQEILGAALVDRDTAIKVSKVPSSLFYYSNHREIHGAIKLLLNQKKEIDLLALIAVLGSDYAYPIAEIGNHGTNNAMLQQRINELRDIRFKHTVANLPPETTMEELEALIERYRPEQEESRSYIPNRDTLLEKVHAYRVTGGLQTLSPGWESMYAKYGIAKGQLSIVTGIPGHGKSTWLDNIAVKMAVTKGFKTCMFSPESMPIEQHYARLIEIHSGYSMMSVNSPILTTVPRISEKQLEESFDFVYNHIKALYIPPEERTLDGIMSQVTSEYDGFVLDPWNEIEHQRSAALSETEYIGQTLMRLKAYAVHKGIHIWLVAHPKKLIKEDGKYQVPQPYDISGSANWYNKADFCISVYQDGGSSQVHVQKVRVRGTGAKGIVYFKFETANQRYYETDEPMDEPEI